MFLGSGYYVVGSPVPLPLPRAHPWIVRRCASVLQAASPGSQDVLKNPLKLPTVLKLVSFGASELAQRDARRLVTRPVVYKVRALHVSFGRFPAQDLWPASGFPRLGICIASRDRRATFAWRLTRAPRTCDLRAGPHECVFIGFCEIGGAGEQNLAAARASD